MPSYKHKKRKKNKHSRKHTSSESSYEEAESGLGKAQPFHSDSDDSSNEDLLSSLVRRSYVDHLRKALKENLNLEIRDSNEITSESVEELADKWTSVLEHKALRTCMMSVPYRQSMVTLIKKVKSDTANKRMTVEDLPHLKMKLPLNQYCQTASCQVRCAETQTETVLKREAAQPDRPYDPAIVFADSPSANDNVSSSQIFDNCKISSTSDFFDNIKTTDLTDALNTLGILPIKFNTIVKTSDSSVERQNSDLLKNNVADPSTSSSSFVKRRESIEKIDTTKDNLDARLNALGFIHESNDEIGLSSNNSTSLSKKSNWFAEEIAQSCNLTRNLLRLSVRKRERVLKRIKELFGDNNEVLWELSEKNIGICRKRIATVVVTELTPIYQDKRIASRRLFKFVAKKITKSLMEKSLAPETRRIRCKVKEFFNDSRIIMSESDCN